MRVFRISRAGVVGLVWLTTLLLAGCVARSAPEISYYSLLDGGPAESGVEVLAKTGNRLGIGPVTIPDSLKRAQIVTRGADQRYRFSEQHRWAGTLEQEIALVLGEDLGHLLAASQVAYFPWSYRFQPDYRLTVDIIRFDAWPGKEAVLQARWAVIGGDDRQTLAAGREIFTEPLTKSGFAAIVAAERRLLDALAHQIARAVANLAR